MKEKVSAAAPKGGARKGRQFSEDPFFMTESKKRRKIADDLDVIDSGESDEEPYGLPGSDSEAEMAAVAKAFVDKIRELVRKKEEDEEEVEEGIHRESETLELGSKNKPNR